MLPVATNVGVGVGVGEGAGLGANVGLGLAVGLRRGLRLGEGDAGLPPQPAMATTRTNPANACPVELRTVSTPGLALTLCLALSSEPLQDDASNEDA
jgi:hypothetical protein